MKTRHVKFVSTGAPKAIGLSGLDDVEEYGASRTVTLLIGRNKGRGPQAKTGRCRKLPSAFVTGAVDQAFITERQAQVGRDNVGATRTTGKGWYQGAPEQSVAYQVAFVPNAKEKTFATFKRNLNRLAEKLARRFCQDSILILRDDGKSRTAAGAK